MAISFNSASSGDADDTPLTFAHTVNAGSNKILIVGVTLEDNIGPATVTGITFDSVALTQIDTQLYDSNANRVDLWYLLNPNEATANVVVTLSASIDAGLSAGAITIDGAKQQAPEADAKAAGSGTTASVAITTVTNNAWVIDCVANSSSTNDMTVGAGQTERWEDSNDQRGNGSTEPVESAGEIAMSWTLSERAWGIVAASFEIADGAPPATGFMTTNTFYWG